MTEEATVSGATGEERRGFEASDGVRLTYWLRRCGRADAPLMALIHGGASNHTRWSELLAVTRLTERWDSLRPDMRGNGASMTRGRLDRSVWCRDLIETLDDAGYRRALFIGHSLGAQIAIDLASAHPARCLGLVLIDPPFREAASGRRLRQVQMAPLSLPLVGLLRLANALGLRRRSFPDRDLHQLDLETRRALAAADDPEELARRYTALGPILRHMPVANYLQQVLATVAPLPPLEEIDLPVLVLVSGASSFADAEATAQQIDRFPNARVVHIPADHWPLTERPVEVREAIEGWVAELAAPIG